MAIVITANPNAEGSLCRVHVTGLTPGVLYSMLRLQMRYVGEDDEGTPHYHRELPDRRHLWHAVAHRVGWQAPAASVTFRDYEPLRRPFRYFIVETDLRGPYEYDWKHNDGPYPVSRGVLGDQVIHLNHEPGRILVKGEVVLRSTWELGLWTDVCVYDLNVGYKFRGNELAVMQREDPLIIADTRETRRGTLTLLTDRLGQYHDLRRMLFPATGRIRPITVHSGGDSTMLLDDMRVIPLDVEIEQATQADPDRRFFHIDFVEVDDTAPHIKRVGDPDNWTDEPTANFTISDTTPARNQWITLTDNSDGLIEEWDWTLHGRTHDNRIGKFGGQGPHKLRYPNKGIKQIKLRINGPEGADVIVKEVEVH